MKTKICKLIHLMMVFIGAAGCATPMIPKTVMSTVSQPPTAFKEILKDPDKYIDKTVLWGGKIIKVKNNKDISVIEVLQMPVDSDGRPSGEEDSQGRFLADIKLYIDPEVYKKDRQISVVGKINGKREQLIDNGEMEYSYPVVAVDNLYLWPKEIYNPAPAYYYYPPWGWWGSYYWNWGRYWGPGWGFGFNYEGPLGWDEGY